MITKETLDNLRKVQQKDYYGSQAQAMFVNRFFNPSNWNGGDGIIRQYFSDFSHGKLRDGTIATEIECKFNELEFTGDIIVTHKWFDDQNYVTIILKGNIYKNNKYIDDIEDIVYLSWYKSRGATETLIYNGSLMTEDEYIFILNALESTGYKFDF
jgi:hypothetical protein